MAMVYIALAIGTTLGYVLGMMHSKQSLETAKEYLEQATIKEQLVTALVLALRGNLTVKEEEGVITDETTDA